MPYQSFLGGEGNSKSLQKYESLNLNPELIRNASVLDIGCNEGYFCFKAAELGAKSVIGIDKTKKWIDAANTRNTYESILFIHSDLSYLSTIAQESIDVVLLLSTMHYLCNPENLDINGIPKIFEAIIMLLKKGGTFIFEGGVEMNNIENKFVRIDRRIGDTVYHPTRTKIEDIFSRVFSKYQYIGQSVKQGGDPIDRYVYYGIK